MAKESKILVLLPYCVENVSRLQKLAEEHGFVAEVLRDDNEALEVVKKYQPSYILGVACPEKAKQVGDDMLSIGEKGEALVLDCKDCFKKTGQRTRIDEELYLETLKRLKRKS